MKSMPLLCNWMGRQSKLLSATFNQTLFILLFASVVAEAQSSQKSICDQSESTISQLFPSEEDTSQVGHLSCGDVLQVESNAQGLQRCVVASKALRFCRMEAGVSIGGQSPDRAISPEANRQIDGLAQACWSPYVAERARLNGALGGVQSPGNDPNVRRLCQEVSDTSARLMDVGSHLASSCDVAYERTRGYCEAIKQKLSQCQRASPGNQRSPESQRVPAAVATTDRALREISAHAQANARLKNSLATLPKSVFQSELCVAAVGADGRVANDFKEGVAWRRPAEATPPGLRGDGNGGVSCIIRQDCEFELPRPVVQPRPVAPVPNDGVPSGGALSCFLRADC